ncbi:DUF2255 family protein [Streptomyces sp. NPDC051704]|uniref:DUF2255 family protein n=1 Tax=Streptomyces sp. NPDC051704 TaxID=3365671 RepID=UPI0037B9DF11
MTMTDWNGPDLEKIAAAEELDLASERSNGTLREAVTMWVVRSGDQLYVRSVKGTDGPWYRGTSWTSPPSRLHTPATWQSR